MLPDTYEVLEKLTKQYEVYIATDYIFRDNEKYSANILKHKFEYLYENLPFIPPKKYIFIANKEIIDCDIKIDDKLSNLKGKSEIKLLFTAYHNKERTDEELKQNGAMRVNGWKDIEKLLLNDRENS
jgi:5'(3')-deoxyribonucleotidase